MADCSVDIWDDAGTLIGRSHCCNASGCDDKARDADGNPIPGAPDPRWCKCFQA